MKTKDAVASKGHLVDEVMKAKKMSKAEATECVDAVLKSIMNTTKNHGELRLIGFLTLKVAKRKASTGRNPRTGKAIEIPEKNVLKISAGKNFKDLVQ